MASDTSPEARERQIAIYRQRGGEWRLAATLTMCDEARELARAGIRARHPSYTDIDVERAVRVLYLGERLFREAWPGEPLKPP